MRSKVFIIEDYNKPLDLPEGVDPSWPVYNAPRPLPGTERWQGEFRHGVFYAAVDPADEYATDYLRRCKELDGHLVTIISDEELEVYAREVCEKYSISRDDHPRKDFVTSMIGHLIRMDEEQCASMADQRGQT